MESSSNSNGVQFAHGIVAIIAGGILSGLYTGTSLLAPMKYIKGWTWENIWFLYAIYGLVLVPWITACFTIKDVVQVYQDAPAAAIAKATGMGVIWGVGSTLFGLGVHAVGNSLAFSIILGLTSGLGAAIPLVSLHPSDVSSKEGISTWVGLGIIIIGLIFVGKAGQMKEKEQYQLLEMTPVLEDCITERQSIQDQHNGYSNQEDTISPSAKSVSPRPSFAIGLVICLFSGLFSPALNFGLTFGSDIKDTAAKLGTPSYLANNATWALVVGGGFIANAIWCAAKMTKSKTWKNFSSGAPNATPLRNAIIGAFSGTVWYGGNVLYGIGSDLIGDLGTVIGFPIFMSLMIITSSIAGYLSGEWYGTSKRTRWRMLMGLGFLVLAVAVMGVGPSL
eukprot:gene2829-8146_t